MLRVANQVFRVGIVVLLISASEMILKRCVLLLIVSGLSTVGEIKIGGFIN